MLISISGLSGSGKDTSAQYLSKRGFQIFSWGTALRLHVAQRFHTPLPTRYRQAVELVPTYLEADKEWEQASGFLEQLIATPASDRDKIYHQNLFRLERILLQGTDIVINDTRFLREFDIVRKFGGLNIWLQREERCRDTQAHDKYLNIENFNYVIENNHSLEELYTVWDNILEKFKQLHSFSNVLH
ncbi:hypothetical protein [Calothrix sp. CCY 0018]|uniref:deoxynucleotide monophosphate kinase family protein n=1 Tax=Calothrix sp. CCY 0018 TaxID=3103864 RepID=UPI0039C6E604